jgi:two-component SAPR family response regulator
MVIFALDDEPMLLKESLKMIESAAPGAEVLGFVRASEALEEIGREGGRRPDIVFSDIEMPGISGLEFAVELKKLCPDAYLVFVTAYPQYALEAYNVRAKGYVMKPLDADRVREEIGNVAGRFAGAAAGPEGRGLLRVRCFGNFEVFKGDEPLPFARKRSKELLAYLVDRNGALCTAEEIAAALWQDDKDIKTAKNHIRQLISDLRNTLSQAGAEEILVRRSGLAAVRRDLLDCDYFRMLDGDMNAVNSFRGEYMSQYDWARMTVGRLEINRKQQ